MFCFTFFYLFICFGSCFFVHFAFSLRHINERLLCCYFVSHVLRLFAGRIEIRNSISTWFFLSITWFIIFVRSFWLIFVLTFLTTSLKIAALSGFVAFMSRLLIWRNSPNCSMYSFSCSRRRFSLLHLFIWDCGCKKNDFFFRMKLKFVINWWCLTHFVVRFSSNFLWCSWRTGNCWCNCVHYFRLRLNVHNLLMRCCRLLLLLLLRQLLWMTKWISRLITNSSWWQQCRIYWLMR